VNLPSIKKRSRSGPASHFTYKSKDHQVLTDPRVTAELTAVRATCPLLSLVAQYPVITRRSADQIAAEVIMAGARLSD